VLVFARAHAVLESARPCLEVNVRAGYRPTDDCIGC
jgi:hypothetical protein